MDEGAQLSIYDPKVETEQIFRYMLQFGRKKLSCVMRKPAFWFLTWSDTNQAVQLQKMARGLKFQI